MGLFSRVFGGRQRTEPTIREITVEPVIADAALDGEELVEIEIVGESFHQDVIGQIAGPKEADGKSLLVGVCFRCEPSNPYDRNAISVEVMGQQVGHVARDIAERLSPAMQQHCRGVLEGRGMIVGGWKDDDSEGSFGVRGWITQREATRLGISQEPLVHPHESDVYLWPTVPNPVAGEERLTPEHGGSIRAIPTNVAVTCEEHYQDAILRSRNGNHPLGWPVLVDLDIAPSPHGKAAAEAIRVGVNGETLGYLTPAMTKRHRSTLEATSVTGHRPTAVGSVHKAKKGDDEIWRIRLGLRMPSDIPITIEHRQVVNRRTGTSHAIAEELADGTVKAKCGATIPKAEVRLIGKTNPGALLIDIASGRAARSHFTACKKCG